jgi:hypothetical protein
MTEAGTSKSTLMSMGADGSDLIPVLTGAQGSQVAFYAVSGGDIYFTDEAGKLYRRVASGTGADEGGKEEIEAPADTSAFNMAGGETYCVSIEQDEDGQGSPNENLWRYSPGGKGEKIAEGLAPGSPINVVGGKIYFFEQGESEGASILYRISTAGTGKEAM